MARRIKITWVNPGHKDSVAVWSGEDVSDVMQDVGDLGTDDMPPGTKITVEVVSDDTPLTEE